MDVTTAVREHVRSFNDAVRSGDYTVFVASFADDAVMTFDGLPIGPFHGRDAIRAAYAAQPPTDTMSIRSIESTAPEAATVHFDWDAGGSGTMRLSWRAGRVATLTIAFD